MNSNRQLLKTQYEYIKQSRAVLLDYCAKLSDEEFSTQNSSFGRGSVSNLLTHTGNTYLFWIGEICMGKNMVYLDYEYIKNMQDIYHHFSTVDALLASFLNDETIYFNAIKQYTIGGVPGSAPILRIITHAFTHEFHHKGQVLSLTRHLGHIPIDTDIMR